MGLIQQEGLNLAPALLEDLLEVIKLKVLFSWFRADRFQPADRHFFPGFNQVHPPKLTGVAVAQVGAVGEVKNHVGVLINFGAGRLVKVTPLHP